MSLLSLSLCSQVHSSRMLIGCCPRIHSCCTSSRQRGVESPSSHRYYVTEGGRLKSDTCEMVGKLNAAEASQEELPPQVSNLKDVNAIQQDQLCPSEQNPLKRRTSTIGSWWTRTHGWTLLRPGSWVLR